MKSKKTAIIFITALNIIIGYSVYNQVKVLDKNKQISSLQSEVSNLEGENEDLQQKVEELEQQVSEIEDDLSAVQHYNNKASVRSGYSSVNSGSIPFTGSVYETQKDGEFQGWEGETIFKMMDGSVWQQVSYDYTYHYSYMPKDMYCV